MVSDLLSFEYVEWSGQIIDSLFSIEEATLIWSITLPISPQENQMVWGVRGRGFILSVMVTSYFSSSQVL